MIAPWESVLALGRPPDGEQLVHRETLPARSARTTPIPAALDPGLAAALRASGIDSLYTHQAEMLAAAAAGDAMVVTGTASGKSLAFNLPVLDAIARDPAARALYLYPTKALAQDQARGLTALAAPNARPAIYDGDTPTGERRQVRGWANLVLTNPDMLHVGILPAHSAWAEAIAQLRYVIVDEAHSYRGVFGSHVANVLARLRRIAAAYGARPRFLLASATIANPAEAGATLAGGELAVIDSDGSAGAARDVCVWNPPLLDAELGIRASTLGEAATLLVGLVVRGQRTIVFAKSRRACELVHRYARQGLQRNAPELAGRIAPYRSGYTPRAAAPDRAAAVRGRPAGRGRHQRARAGGGHRPARLRDQRRLSGGDGVAAPAVGPGRQARAGAGHAGGGRGSARPVPRPAPPAAGRAAGRGGRLEPGQPGRAGGPPALRGGRAAAHRRRPRPLRRGGAWRWPRRCRS